MFNMDRFRASALGLGVAAMLGHDIEAARNRFLEASMGHPNAKIIHGILADIYEGAPKWTSVIIDAAKEGVDPELPDFEFDKQAWLSTGAELVHQMLDASLGKQVDATELAKLLLAHLPKCVGLQDRKLLNAAFVVVVDMATKPSHQGSPLNYYIDVFLKRALEVGK